LDRGLIRGRERQKNTKNKDLTPIFLVTKYLMVLDCKTLEPIQMIERTSRDPVEKDKVLAMQRSQRKRRMPLVS
jgi:hypothetical protein